MILALCWKDLKDRGKAVDNLLAVAERFKTIGKVTDVREFGNGNINNTFLVTMDTTGEKHFILQRVNTQVFRQPESIIRNMRTVSGHIHKRLKDVPLDAGRRWEVPRVLLTEDEKDHWLDSDGAFWRALSYIDGAQSFSTIPHPTEYVILGQAPRHFVADIASLQTLINHGGIFHESGQKTYGIQRPA